MVISDFKNLIYFLSGFNFFSLSTYLFCLLILVLCAFIILYLNIRNRQEAKFTRWKFISDNLIRSAIFFEEEENIDSGKTILKTQYIPLPGRFKKLLPDFHFRKLLTKELLTAKQNMSGTAASNLRILYKQLGLDEDALKMINSRSWYLKASGIQQLEIMDLSEYKDKISKYTNNKRGLVRVEAQNAIVKFNGFEGLHFLDHATYQISEWQQIKLLEELSRLPVENFPGIDIWLSSKNDSVVTFALKLAREYNRFELYDKVFICLKHLNPKVREQAISTLKELQTENTANHLVEIYNDETHRNKIAIIKALEDVGTNLEITFLLGLLDSENNQVKIAAARALASIGSEGLLQLQSYEKANDYPYKNIIDQIKAEKV